MIVKDEYRAHRLIECVREEWKHNHFSYEKWHKFDSFLDAFEKKLCKENSVNSTTVHHVSK